MFELPVRVTASLVGADQLCAPVALLDMLQDCSLLWFEREAAATGWLAREGLGIVLTSRQVDIVRRPRYGERLSVRTGVYSFKGFLGYRNTWIYDEQDNPVVKCWCMGAFIDLASGKMSRIPAQVSEAVTIDSQLPMEYLPHKVALPQGEPAVSERIAVRPSDIDLNGHVNNARYVRMVCDALPQLAGSCDRIRMEYKGQARLGDVLALEAFSSPDAPDAAVAVLRKESDGSVCAVVEMGCAGLTCPGA